MVQQLVSKFIVLIFLAEIDEPIISALKYRPINFCPSDSEMPSHCSNITSHRAPLRLVKIPEMIVTGRAKRPPSILRLLRCYEGARFGSGVLFAYRGWADMGCCRGNALEREFVGKIASSATRIQVQCLVLPGAQSRGGMTPVLRIALMSGVPSSSSMISMPW